MALRLNCPGCDTALNVAETLIGKTIKCKTCGEMIPVTAPAKAAVARRAAAIVDDDEPVKASRRKWDDSDDDAPVPAKSSGGSKGLMIAGIAAGLLLLLGGGMAGAYFLFAPSTDVIAPVAANTESSTSNRISDAGTPTPPVNEEKKPEPKPEVKKEPEAKPANTGKTVATNEEQKASGSPPKKEDNPKAAEPVTPKVETQPPVSASLGQNSEEHNRKMMSGQMDEITTEQCKRATVLIECEDKFGGRGHGSGWFGIEQNIVITNAHVISMKAPNSPPPAKLTIFINSGEYGQNPGVLQREIPHQRIKILAVDRANDIAILEITGEKDLPVPMRVRPSAKLKERQGITILGFPLGLDPARNIGSKKMPSISVRPSTITALRYDDFGILRKVQLEGGANHGNSGGPQVDAEGYAISMTVSVLFDGLTLSQVQFGVPIEQIQGILAGRPDQMLIDTAYNENGSVRIPISISAQDPMKRLKSIGISSWVGDSTGNIRPPGETRKGVIGTDKDYQEVKLNYDPVTKTANGFVTLPPLTPGQAYWLQPFFQNAIYPKYYMAGIKVNLKGPPVDRVASNLSVNLRQNQVRPFTLKSKTAEEEFTEGDDGDLEDITKITITMKGTETVIAPDASDSLNAARLRLKYDDCDLEGEDRLNEGKALPPRLMSQLKTGIKSLEAIAYVNRSGGIYKSRTNSLGVTDPLTKVIGPPMSTYALQALQECSIPLPNKEVQANETWGTTRTIPLAISFISSIKRSARDNQPNPPGGGGGGGRPRPGARPDTVEVGRREYLYNQDIKFTYQGIRTRAGRKEAVIRYDGKITPAAGQAKDSINGGTKGYAFVDVSTGVITDAEIESTLEVDTSLQGMKQRTFSINNYTLTRGGNLR